MLLCYIRYWVFFKFAWKLKLQQNYLINHFIFPFIFLMKERLCFNKTSGFSASKSYSGTRQCFLCLSYSQSTSLHLTSNVLAVFCIILPSKLKNHTLNVTMLEECGYVQAKTIFRDELLMNVNFGK